MVKKICILVATRKRKTSLIKFLNSIVNLQIPTNISVQTVISINDNQSYSEIKKLYNEKLSIKLVTERKKGISNARNKYLNSINTENFDYFAFFDDDIQIDKRWLIEMLKFFKKSEADIIGGPQFSKSKSLTSKLLVREEKHGSNVRWVSTNNCIVKSKVLETKINFDQKMNHIGGEDQLFFLKLNRMGFKMMWNTRAVVIEETNNKRENFLWFLKRNFRYGASSNLIYKKAYGLMVGLSFLVVKFLLDFAMLTLSLLGLITLTKKSFYKVSMYFCRILGLIFGLLGFQYKEYA
jgi:succinoglycan biosynthesis protein ExoM